MAAQPTCVLSVRVPAGDYTTAVFAFSFLSAFLLYLEFGLIAIAAILLVPVAIFCAWGDRLNFDGKRIYRTGLIFRAWSRLFGFRTSLRVNAIDSVHTSASRSFKRGGRVLFRYRTSFHGRGIRFSASSKAATYEEFMRAVLPLLSEEVLDHQSMEIRDYFREPTRVLADALRAGIPSADVLEGSFRRFRIANTRANFGDDAERETTGTIEAARWVTLANELKVSGRLLQSLEAFRRALRLRPADPRIMFDMSRCLCSLAGVRRDRALERRAAALMRLAEKHAGDDRDLLTNLAESYFRSGDLRRSSLVFQQIVERFGGNVRSLTGLAELALREGKMAHVVLNFAAAAEIADSRPVRQRTRDEVEYFTQLSESDEYMELELSRINLLDALQHTRTTATWITLFGFPVIGLGLLVGNSILSDLGWAVSGIALLVWIAAGVFSRMFVRRIPYENVEEG